MLRGRARTGSRASSEARPDSRGRAARRTVGRRGRAADPRSPGSRRAAGSRGRADGAPGPAAPPGLRARAPTPGDDCDGVRSRTTAPATIAGEAEPPEVGAPAAGQAAPE